MATVEVLCQSYLYIADDECKANGLRPARPSEIRGAGYCGLREHPRHRNDSELLAWSLCALYPKGTEPTGIIRIGQPLMLHGNSLAVKAFRPVLGVGIKTVYDVPIFNISDRFARQLAGCNPTSSATVAHTIDEFALMPGTYTADLRLGMKAVILIWSRTQSLLKWRRPVFSVLAARDQSVFGPVFLQVQMAPAIVRSGSCHGPGECYRMVD